MAENFKDKKNERVKNQNAIIDTGAPATDVDTKAKMEIEDAPLAALDERNDEASEEISGAVNDSELAPTEGPGLSASQEEIAKLNALIKEIKVTMLVTKCDGGEIRSRPMATQEIDSTGSVWFFTDHESAKIHEVENQSHVNLAFAHPSHNTYVSISGRAREEKDRKKMEELWTPILKAWFPKGLEDPNLTLLKVEIIDAEYWDSPSNKVVQLFGMAKALVTGERYQPGEHRKIAG